MRVCALAREIGQDRIPFLNAEDLPPYRIACLHARQVTWPNTLPIGAITPLQAQAPA
jgi:hypothetical protein